MQKVYANLVRNSRRQITDVPARLRPDVSRMLDLYTDWEIKHEYLAEKTIGELKAYMDAYAIDQTGCSLKADFIRAVIAGQNSV